jgi:endonuclease III
MSEQLMATAPAAQRLPQIVQLLRVEHPDAKCALDFQNAFELLVATILSAQCTDERVNKTTPALFARFPTPAAMAAAEISELEALVKSTGFYRNKAKNIQAASRRISELFAGEVPNNMADLLTLTGVARKTANVVLGNAFAITDGIVVDTHMRRLSNRLGLSQHEEPEKIEQDLMAITPRDEWIDLSHLLIFHGRRVCDARKPACGRCVLNQLCPSVEILL